MGFFPLMKIAYDYNRKAFYFFIVICATMTIGNEFLFDSGKWKF